MSLFKNKLDTIHYNIIQRRLYYIKIANKELVKKFAGQTYSDSAIKACDKFIRVYAKPVIIVHTDGTVTSKNSEFKEAKALTN